MRCCRPGRSLRAQEVQLDTGKPHWDRVIPGPRQRVRTLLVARRGSGVGGNRERSLKGLRRYHEEISLVLTLPLQLAAPCWLRECQFRASTDRKSTRLNSSH